MVDESDGKGIDLEQYPHLRPAQQAIDNAPVARIHTKTVLVIAAVLGAAVWASIPEKKPSAIPGMQALPGSRSMRERTSPPRAPEHDAAQVWTEFERRYPPRTRARTSGEPPAPGFREPQNKTDLPASRD